jgi:hypothetical protein
VFFKFIVHKDIPQKKVASFLHRQVIFVAQGHFALERNNFSQDLFQSNSEIPSFSKNFVSDVSGVADFRLVGGFE